MKSRNATLLICGLLVVHSCASRPETPPRTIVLFDLSGSTANPEVRARYLQDFKLVATSTAERHGAIYGEIIGANPTDDSVTPIAQDFMPTGRFQGNALYEKAEIKRRIAAADAQAELVLRQAAQPGTDIFSGITLAARLARRFGGSGRITLVLFSDMLETHTFNFYTADLSSNGLQSMIRSLRSSGRIPDLHGVNVYVTGAGIDPSGKLPAERNFAIERFWIRYFTEAGAVLESGHYTARLVTFP